MRKRLDDLDAALDQDIGPSPVIAGNPSDQDAQRETDCNAEKPDGQREARPVDHARQQIAPESVGSGQEQLPAVGRANKVQVAGKQPPEAICTTMTEEAYWLPLLRVRRIDSLQVVHVEPVVIPINKGWGETALIEDPDSLWRGIDKIRVPRIQIIRGEEFAKEDRQIHRQKYRAGQKGDPVAAQLPPHHSPFRRHVKALLRRRHPFNRIGVERGIRDVVWQWVGGMFGQAAVARSAAGSKDEAGHSRRPACSRMRGSSTANARSDTNTPMTVRNAMNTKNEPARYMS